MFQDKIHLRCTFAGLGLGLVAALVLLVLGSTDTESMEGSNMLAYLLSLPAGFLFDWLDWGHYASQWEAFIVIAPSLNGLLLGWLAGAAAALVRARLGARPA